MAASRELSERTGFTIDPKKLKFVKFDKDTITYEGHQKDLNKVANPGELGGYSTIIKWMRG